MGIDFRMMPPTVKYQDGKLSASTDDNSHIYYSVEGDDGVYPYVAPIKTDKPQVYVFHTELGGARSTEVAVEAYYKMIEPAVKITSSRCSAPIKRRMVSRACSYISVITPERW